MVINSQVTVSTQELKDLMDLIFEKLREKPKVKILK